ncbi:MAG: HAMP domain-containing protein, partial [Acidobacteriota bacterium]|nr:HAMP domain-containing protein [Acidobacteriota bacterium]
RSRRLTQAFENYNQLRVLKQPLTGVYLSFFLMVTLLILVGAVWMGLYLAKRITRPVQMLAAAAREIGAGRLDQRVEPETNDEFGSLVEAFNAMAGELAATITEGAFEYLDGPILRVTAPDTPIPFSPPLEEAFLPNAEKVLDKARWLYRY